MINYVIINGVNSNTKTGLAINELPPITKPSMRTQTEEIDGRDGDIITKLGYSAYDKTITIGLFGTGYDVNDIISFFTSEGTITFSNEPDKYYKFTMLEQIDVESLLRFKTASITFHCQPFKYPSTETPLEIEYDYIEQTGETLTLNNTGESILDLSLKGNTSQSGAPTPDSPIPIHSVTGDNEVVVCGKNLIDNTIVSTSQDGTGEWTYLPAGTYYAKRFRHPDISVDTYNSRLQIIVNGTLTNVVQNATIDNGDISISGTDFGWYSTGVLATLVLKKGYNIRTTGLDYFDMMVQKTNDVNAYEPYQSQTYPINLGGLELCKIGDYQDYITKNSGKNLLNLDRTLGTPSDTSASNSTPRTFDTSTYVVGMSGNNYYYPSNINSYSLSNNIIKINSSSNSYGLAIPMKLDKGTYTLSFNYSSGNISFVSLSIYDSNNLCNTFTNISSGGTFTIDNDNTNILLTFKSTNNVENTYTNIMLINGTEDIPYEPYGTGKWCKYNAIGKVVLDGSEPGWMASSTYQGSFYISILGEKGIYNTPLFNNLFKRVEIVGSIASSYIKGTCFIENINTFDCWYGDSSSELSNFKTYLSNNNMILFYPLNAPYLSLIEDTTLISQLDNIQNAMSYEGQTNVMQVNDDKPFIISAKALEQGSDEVVVNNIGNATSKPLIALEGTGNINIYLDGTQVLQANVEDKMNIDIDKLEAYNPDTSALLNRQVTGNYNSMTIPSGESIIKIDGALDKATISNYTRWL